MKIYHEIGEFEPVRNAVLTIGTFDGLHEGHQRIIQQIKSIAAATDGQTILLTFFPHPRMIIQPEDESLKMLTTIEEKQHLLETLGIDHLIISPFNRDFSNMSPDEYIEKVLVKHLHPKHIVVGYDHRFGKNRLGGFDELVHASHKFGFDVTEISKHEIDEHKVSSTQIREALLIGDVKQARQLLGYSFFVTGQVIKGDKIGRTIGYPTANIYIQETYKLIPSDGVYSVTVDINGHRHKGMAYIGKRPTINGMTRNVEVNIFDFESEIYGQNIKMNFESFIRGDQRFDGLDALKKQLGIDKENAIKYLNSL